MTFYLFLLFSGEMNIRPFSTEKAATILKDLPNKHIANDICFHGKTNIPERDIQTLYKQIILDSTQTTDKIILL